MDFVILYQLYVEEVKDLIGIQHAILPVKGYNNKSIIKGISSNMTVE